ncbi:molybdopterin molybdenumtransferase MoeA [Vulcanimicrobium alpinum]|uniref:Molybdopterin molybdenumtransferase n=2 Tax=Vulcanimicrobium alpinum TaxID=3016050 RepID=A0AAN1XZA5_UNVUL|nr:molybdopterin molybdenumtransferase MoeA [Vulcanimicrobium alpinum]
MRPGEGFDVERLREPAEAVAAYLAAVRPMPPGIERVALADAFGRVLAQDAVAEAFYPADARSTMDGFAVRSTDGTALRRIAGTIRMGAAPPGPVHVGEAMRIPTGGVLPPGADAVVPLENVRDDGESIAVDAAPAAGDSFTPRGDDMRPGDRIVGAGCRIAAPELSVLATLGIVDVPVFVRPRIAVVSTGDELVDAAEHPGTGQVRDSNRWAIAGSLLAMGCTVVHLPRAVDEEDAIAARIADGLAGADAVVLTGGSSVGARDHVPAAIARLGAPGIVVHGLKVKPGKPTVLAAIGARPVLGLPGNPTSALMILEAVAAPIVRALTGERHAAVRRIATVAAAPFGGRPGWTWYVPAAVGADGARPLVLRSSHTSLLARAGGYVVVGPESSRIESGAAVTVLGFGGR